MNKFFKHPILIVVILFLITVFFGAQIPRLRISGNMANFLPDDNKAVTVKRKIQEVFGSQENVVVIMKVEEGAILEPDSIEMIAGITDAVGTVPYVEETTSLTNMDYLQGVAGGMLVEKLVDPNTPPRPDEIYGKLTSWEVYENLLYSEDFKSTQIIVTLASQKRIETEGEIIYSDLTDRDYELSINTIRDILKENTTGNFSFLLAGEKVINQTLKTGIIRDLIFLLPILIFVLILILFFAFRTPGGIILPLLTVLTSSVWTIGFMSLVGVQLSILTMVIPILLVAVGSAYGIHILGHYYDALKTRSAFGPIDKTGHNEIIYHTLQRVGLPVILAGVTTVAGFGSLSPSSISAMKEMGIFAALGVMFAIFNSFLLIPSVLALKSVRHYNPRKRKERTSLLSTAFAYLSKHLTAHNYRTIILVVLLIFVSGLGFTKIVIGQPWINFFKKSSEMYVADKFVNENFGGTTVLSVLISGNEVSAKNGGQGNNGGDAAEDPIFSDEDFLNPDGVITPDPDAIKIISHKSVKTPELLKAIDLMGEDLKRKFPQVEKISSLAGLIKQLNKVMHADVQTLGVQAGELPVIFEDILKNDNAISGKELVREVYTETNFRGEAFYEVPINPEKYGKKTMDELQRLISQYLFLYSGNLDTIVDNADNPVQTLVRIQMREAHPKFLEKVIKEVDAFAAEYIEPLGYSVETSGYAKEMLEMNRLIVKNQLISIALALGFVILVISLTNRSLLAGLFCAIPIAITLLINFGFMGFAGYPLDVVTAMIASLAIGIGIDYSIHFLSTYKRELQASHNHDIATLKTLDITGKAIVFNAVSVAAGFAVLLSSMLFPLNTVGAMIVITMFSSSFLAMTLLPALFKTFNPSFLYAVTKKQMKKTDN